MSLPRGYTITYMSWVPGLPEHDGRPRTEVVTAYDATDAVAQLRILWAERRDSTRSPHKPTSTAWMRITEIQPAEIKADVQAIRDYVEMLLKRHDGRGHETGRDACAAVLKFIDGEKWRG